MNKIALLKICEYSLIAVLAGGLFLFFYLIMTEGGVTTLAIFKLIVGLSIGISMVKKLHSYIQEKQLEQKQKGGN